MNTFFYAISALLILTGLAGAVVPLLPGIPLIFGGIWLLAAIDGYQHIGFWWLLGITVIGAIGVTVDLIAGSLGAKRVGASPQAVGGALAGTLLGMFFGIPGLLFGPFMGAVLGELAAGHDALRSARVGLGTWLGLLCGAVIKLVSSVMMVAMAGAAWWWSGHG